MSTSRPSVGFAELATLRRVALAGGYPGETKLSSAGLAEEIDVSTQTVSRRLQALEAAGLLDRDTVADGQWVRLTEAGERALREEYEAYRQLFESPAHIELRGTVTSGMGEGRHYISLPGYMTQFAAKLGYEPFAGTLNLELDAESVRARAGLAAFTPIPIDGWEGDDRTYGPAVCYSASVETADGDGFEPVHVITPERTHHDDDQLEVIAPVKLRDELDVADDDPLIVSVEGRP